MHKIIITSTHENKKCVWKPLQEKTTNNIIFLFNSLLQQFTSTNQKETLIPKICNHQLVFIYNLQLNWGTNLRNMQAPTCWYLQAPTLRKHKFLDVF